MGTTNSKGETLGSDDNLQDLAFTTIKGDLDKPSDKEVEKDTEEEKNQADDKKEEKAMSPGIAMGFFAAKGDVENMKKIYMQSSEAVHQCDTTPVQLEEVKDAKKKTKKEEDEKEDAMLVPLTGDTPLHKAAGEGQVAAVELLLNWEVDVEIKNRIGSTPLHRACSHGQIEVVQKLLANSSSVDTLNKIGNSPLHCAALAGYADIAKLICTSGGFKHLRRPNLAGMTPIDYAKNCRPMLEFFQTYDVKSKTSPRSYEFETKNARGGKGSFHRKHLVVEGDRSSFHKKTVTIQEPPRKTSVEDLSQPITLHIRTP